MSEVEDRSTTRRGFLRTAAIGLLAAGFAPRLSAADSATDQKTRNSICVFSKPFNSLSYGELADRIAELGFDGIEAPIRAGGHIESEQVPNELPKLVEVLKSRGLDITVLTSDVNDPNDPVSQRVLRTAVALGVRRYRMKYFKYDLKQPILPQIDNWRSQVRELAAFNAELGITAVYQNHAGRNYCGAPLWDLQRLLDGIPVSQVGVAFDIRHATVEGTMSWPVSFQMLRPHIDTIYVKDFRWADNGQPENVPLGEGHVSSEFFRMLAASNFAGPISLHEEYLDHRNSELVPEHLAAIKRDFGILKMMLGRA
ncbi:TIM barrel protein [bacterium]|nr:TIM barrel protein [bacterium]